MAKEKNVSYSLSGMNFASNVGFTLDVAVRGLAPGAKQAFYSAAQRRGILRRRTWDGCAFNAGARELGINDVGSVRRAAEVFKCSPFTVSRFIKAWDGSNYSNDREATRVLVGMLESVGLFSLPDSPTVTRVYKGLLVPNTLSDEDLIADFMVDINDLDKFISGWAEAHTLLYKEPADATSA